MSFYIGLTEYLIFLLIIFMFDYKIIILFDYVLCFQRLL